MKKLSVVVLAILMLAPLVALAAERMQTSPKPSSTPTPWMGSPCEASVHPSTLDGSLTSP